MTVPLSFSHLYTVFLVMCSGNKFYSNGQGEHEQKRLRDKMRNTHAQKRETELDKGKLKNRQIQRNREIWRVETETWTETKRQKNS